MNVVSLEMESSALIHLAHSCKTNIYAAACAMVFADRNSGEFISEELADDLERRAGCAILDALVDFSRIIES